MLRVNSLHTVDYNDTVCFGSMHGWDSKGLPKVGKSDTDF